MIINTILSIIRWLNKLLFNINNMIRSVVTVLFLYIFYKIFSSWVLDKVFQLFNSL